MKTKANGKPTRVELGEHIVADPLMCHGKPTFKGTRIMVWQILDELAHGMSPAEIVKAWGGKIPAPPSPKASASPAAPFWINTAACATLTTCPPRHKFAG